MQWKIPLKRRSLQTCASLTLSEKSEPQVRYMQSVFLSHPGIDAATADNVGAPHFTKQDVYGANKQKHFQFLIVVSCDFTQAVLCSVGTIRSQL